MGALAHHTQPVSATLEPLMSTLRTILPVALVSFALLSGCGNPDQEPPAESGSQPGTPGVDPVDPIEYAGTWTIDIDYELECEYFTQTREESFSGTWALPLEGDNENLHASLESGWFVLEGSGDQDRIRLSGSFHLDAIWDDASSGSDNNISFDGSDVISADEVHGTMTGSFIGGGGEDCVILDGTFEMTR
jgi:hypothetical protein